MKRIHSVTSALFLLGCFAEAHAVGSLAEVAVIDRDSGRTLPTHYYRGEYWVAGTPGARYAIEIRNHLGERLLAVTSVDGVNVISGATAGWNQTGYVFNPGQGYQITGWRKSDADVAAFAFTTSPNSYAERTGRPANVGVIGVALFRERPVAVAPPAVIGALPESRDRLSSNSTGSSGSPGSASSNGSASSLDSSNSPVDAARASEAERAAPAAPAAGLSGLFAKKFSNNAAPILQAAPKLGTAHGERENSWVTHTEFERLQPEPNEVVRIRYDSLENLVAMGVVPLPGLAPGTPNPFPGMTRRSYVPDPPG